MLGTGFIAARKTISLPFDMPPSMPPELFERNAASPSTVRIASLFSLPVRSAAPNPAPNSMPFTPPIDRTAFASSASSLSKTVSPSPAGTPCAVHSTMPPALSPSARRRATRASISFAAFSSHARKEVRSTASISRALHEMPAAEIVYALTLMPAVCSTAFATAPAATREAVSRPDERPPPRQSRTPYFLKYV